MEPGSGFSLFAGWRHPAMNMGMDLTQAAYRYNQNMMEYYTCKNSKSRYAAAMVAGAAVMIENHFQFS